MAIGIQCLLSDSIEAARPLAAQLDALNAERKSIEGEMQTQADDLMRRLPDEHKILPRGLALYEPTWHMGVVGILASRVKEKYHRPVICFAQGDEGQLKGSARSVSGVHIRDVLDRISTQHPGIIIKFGGHAMAAGLTIVADQYALFVSLFAETVSEFLKEEDCLGIHWSDGELAAHEISRETAYLLDAAGPFGAQFPPPMFDNVFSVVSRQPMGGDKHMRYRLALPEGRAVEAVHFNASPETWAEPGQAVRLAYSIDLNYFRGEERLQLKINYIDAQNA